MNQNRCWELKDQERDIQKTDENFTENEINENKMFKQAVVHSYELHREYQCLWQFSPTLMTDLNFWLWKTELH